MAVWMNYYKPTVRVRTVGALGGACFLSECLVCEFHINLINDGDNLSHNSSSQYASDDICFQF